MIFSRNANDATWHILRYAEHYAPRTPDPVDDPAPPELEPTLFFDDLRGVLELVPERPTRERSPLPGLAIAPNGRIYFVEPASGRLLTKTCDQEVSEVVCEPRVFAGPRGLALDRRGFLYVADARAKRVVVLEGG